MAKNPIKKVTAKKKKIKKWISVMAPKEFGNISLGEIYVEETEKAVGRVITLNMLSVTGDHKKQNTNLRFLIDKAQGNQASSILIGCEIPPAHLKRMARKARSKIEDSFVCSCKEGGKMVIKPVIVLKGEAPRSVTTAIRVATIEGVKKRAGELDIIKFFQSILRQDIQKQMKAELKKIYPVTGFTIRIAEISK